MIFYAQNGKERPVRLCEETRRFAYESLNRKYGRQTRATPAVTLDDIEGFASLTEIEKYDLAIRRIAERAPIRICEDELLSGAATLGRAIDHLVPASFGSACVCPSISHLTVNFEDVLKRGIAGIEADAREAYERYRGTEKEPFIKSCLNCIDAFKIWHGRYLMELERRGLEKNKNNLLRVPYNPPRNFYEAVQSIWFTFAFLRLCGNWPGIGRIDYLLGQYLKADLEAGSITLSEAREILAHFFIKGCEWVCADNEFSAGSGDAQHYQNILLGGTNEDGEEVTCEVTYLVLDVLEELGIGDFPTSVRLNKNSDEALLRRVGEVMSFGGGILAVYNEDLVISALTKDGYSEREARKFANDGCWEVQIPGKTFFGYIPFDSLQTLQQKTLGGYDGDAKFESFEELYSAYVKDLKGRVRQILDDIQLRFSGKDGNGEWVWKRNFPCTVVSLFEDGCIQKGLSYTEGGPVYNIIAPHIGGLADTANSLYAIKRLVYEDKRVTLSELFKILKSNWEGNEPLRLYAQNKYSYYGNDNDECDGIVARILSDFADICRELDKECGYHFASGVSTFGRQLEWAPKRLASPHGKRAGEVLAGNCSPTPGSDKAGATAIIRSYCKPDLSALATGAALDIRLLPSAVKGEEGVETIVSLMRGFVALGGFFMQPDVVDASVLRAAQENPENYQTLSVRVSGWNARFVTMSKTWQDMVIEQNEH